MRISNQILGAVLMLVCCDASMAETPTLHPDDANTVVNLAATDLVKKQNLLDCSLRLEGQAPHYKLVYSLGEISVPPLAIKKEFGHSHMQIAVKAEISGLPVNGIFIRYHDDDRGKYEMKMNCHGDNVPCDAPVAYVLSVSRPEKVVLQILRSKYEENLIVDSARSSDVNQGAIMIRNRPTLVSPAMDGLKGANDIRETNLHYVCITE